jgi:Rad3-related DNA helicase
MTWSLYEEDDEFLKPMSFSSGKTQEDVVKEVLDAINGGEKIIFIHGVCGTGKSAIALNIAKELGKTSVVVPGKALQNQYKKDYENNKYLLGKDGKKLKISVITGRVNHKCPFLEDNNQAVPKIKKEINANLNDIFEFDEGSAEEMQKRKDDSANVYDLPCKIEIKEKNWRKLKEYIRRNRRVDSSKFLEIRDVTRASVARVCPYWSPVVPGQFELKSFPDSRKKSYDGLKDTKFIIHKARPGCSFYEQFDSYLDSDIIVFNSMKYVLESALNRKPLTEIEIIDECDEFLDKFSNQRTINLDRLQNTLVYTVGFGEEFDNAVKELGGIIKQLKTNDRVREAIESDEIIPLKETGIYDLIRVFLKSPEFLSQIDDENYLFDIEETSRIFEDFLDESYVSFSKKDNVISASVVTTNLAKRFKEMVDKNKRFVLMSGTLHSDHVLKNIFGIEKFKIIEAETEAQGKIEVLRTGLEKDCKYSNFSQGKITREGYLKALSKCVSMAKTPVLVHINAFTDLPSEKEIEEYDIDNIISREKLRELQMQDKHGKIIDRFKSGQMNVLFSTRASRGIDFPGEECNSIIFTKYPNPNVKDAFWKILNQTRPQDYWDFYKDKARRELWQKIYRGLRFKEDHVYLLSPDSRVLDAFENI